MNGFRDTLDTDWIEDHKKMKDKLIDSKNYEQVQRQIGQDD